jgi:Spy/CpxP family protein refolding chaperone
MRTAKLLMAAALAAGVLTTVPVLAHSFEGRGGCRQHAMWNGGMERMAERLGLSHDQRQALDAIDDKYRPQLRSLREQMWDNGKALHAARAEDAKLRTLADAEGKALADMIVLRKQMRAEIDKVLTDEQRERLHRFMEHRRDPWGERRQRQLDDFMDRG